jgi:predicted ATPase
MRHVQDESYPVILLQSPFFVIQFLKMLTEEKLLTFDYGQGSWTFRLEAITGAAITDNVVDLMLRKIQRLSPGTQQALTLAACIGNPFELDTLATVSQQSAHAALASLQEALDEGLVAPASRPYEAAGAGSTAPALAVATYAFLHDRVQQAAYTLIPDARKRSVHLTVGRLLLGQGGTAVEERLFDIVQHLNLGSDLLCKEDERLQLVVFGRSIHTNGGMVS